MEFQIEENVEYTFYPYEHPFDNARRIELGSGKIYYIYQDHQPLLCVQVPCQPSGFTDAVIFHDRLMIGSYDDGVFVIDLKDVEGRADLTVRTIETEGYFGYFVVDRDVLYVLAMRHVYAFDRDLRLLWKSDPLSTDGVVLDSVTEDVMAVSCCHDSTEAWFVRKISLKNGKIIP